MTQLRSLPLPVLAVLAGAETGVELADRLSFRMGLRSNGESGSFARRNKYDMGEKVRATGARAVMQRLCRTDREVVTFLCEMVCINIEAEGGITAATAALSAAELKCVIKPVQSAGTDHVFLCSSVAEALDAFDDINGKRNGLGLINDGALVQEYLEGKEYVIDKVSRDGVHKLVAVWEYDKRRCNNANFVYFGNRLRASNSEKVQEMIR